MHNSRSVIVTIKEEGVLGFDSVMDRSIVRGDRNIVTLRIV